VIGPLFNFGGVVMMDLGKIYVLSLCIIEKTIGKQQYSQS
jgi:hypothetical protein